GLADRLLLLVIEAVVKAFDSSFGRGLRLRVGGDGPWGGPERQGAGRDSGRGHAYSLHEVTPGYQRHFVVAFRAANPMLLGHGHFSLCESGARRLRAAPRVKMIARRDDSVTRKMIRLAHEPRLCFARSDIATEKRKSLWAALAWAGQRRAHEVGN